MQRPNHRHGASETLHLAKRRRLDKNLDGASPYYRATTSTQFCHSDYTVGWICALPLELAAATAMLDEIHPPLSNSPTDHNTYTLGQMGVHNVAVACIPSGVYGTTSAATVAHDMESTFPSVRVRLMVGIGGGAPSEQADIRLGDVVVSKPAGNHSGVVQYDYGKTVQHGGFERVGTLNKPPQLLLTAVSRLQANHMLRPSRIPDYLTEIATNYPDMAAKFTQSVRLQDQLFDARYEHNKSESNCKHCDPGRLVYRPVRSGNHPGIHYGLIASGNQVMKHGETRERLAQQLGILCFEMEAAGLMDQFPCLVIRGICDYADSHKNKVWQNYAAVTAAAYAKELLSVVSAIQLSEPPPTSDERPLPDEEQRRWLLESLRFDQIDTRHLTIKKAHANTCKWLLKRPEYLHWLDSEKFSQHHGFLWIKGKPGAGKSTLMKFAVTNARKSMKSKTVISFFFNARGGSLEKSTIGMYRSLLLQLFERLPGLQIGLDCLELAAWDGESHDWTIESLKALFHEAVGRLGQSSLVCFIDALDECDENQIREMITFFQSLGQPTTSNHARFQVCFASRHYPHITIAKGLNMDLEGQEGHTQDITNYIDNELRIGHSNQAEQVRADLQEKSSGVFMWVVLVVDILNKEHDEGRTIRRLQQKLKDIPRDLHELFRDLLTRDLRNQDELLLCIQWLLFAKQPLTPVQLYYGIISGIEPEDISKWDPDETPMDAIEKFILNSSKGLAEITKSKTPTVQFIHESVKDFLLKENGLGEVWSNLGSNFYGESHERLKQCCLNYLSIDVDYSIPLTDPLPKASTQEANNLYQSVLKWFPFLEYATRSVLYHANEAQATGVSQADFLQTFQLPRWVRLDNLFEKAEIRRHTPYVSLLYILAERNMFSLVRIHPSSLSCFEIEAERYGPPIFAAIATGSTETVQTLLKIQADDQPPTSPLHNLHEQYYQVANKRVDLGRTFTFSQRRDLSSYLYEHKDGILLAFLCASYKFGTESTYEDHRTMLSWAVTNGSEVVVKLLLAKGADLESKDEDGGKPLYWAAANGHAGVAKLLLEKGVNPGAKNYVGVTPLSIAAFHGHEAVVTLLLEKGVDLESIGFDGRTPLSSAACKGHKAVAMLLLDKGANIEFKDDQGRTPLWWVAMYGSEAVARRLLDKGADPGSKDNSGQTPLSIAARKGHSEVVRLLQSRLPT
ncbi:hypothetical protein LTR84_002108 [Exophiala bonariae]|uniref:Nucleoside phosphorylase domain-containing protein n=1 Tax=Exophiala bonariae TaxID=1690606 RepID=A0AAV9ND13_9EURO|nr:hypothetical protein LTR84_002108 [Exophiala bonariae]